MGKGWLGAPLITTLFCKVKKIKNEARNAREPCEVGSRGPLKGPDGDQGAKPPEALAFFNAEKAFSTPNYTH